VDVHVHGGGGGSFDGDEASARRAAGYHLARGSTSVLASLVSAPAEQLLRSVALLADLVEERVLAGIHLEGPFLADSRRGAHDAAHLVPPDLDLLAGLLDTGRGHVRQVTIALSCPAR
jgi:N-acetylglucosamine-6-phosphate deacetylase